MDEEERRELVKLEEVVGEEMENVQKVLSSALEADVYYRCTRDNFLSRRIVYMYFPGHSHIPWPSGGYKLVN